MCQELTGTSVDIQAFFVCKCSAAPHDLHPFDISFAVRTRLSRLKLHWASFTNDKRACWEVWIGEIIALCFPVTIGEIDQVSGDKNGSTIILNV